MRVWQEREGTLPKERGPTESVPGKKPETDRACEGPFEGFHPAATGRSLGLVVASGSREPLDCRGMAPRRVCAGCEPWRMAGSPSQEAAQQTTEACVKASKMEASSRHIHGDPRPASPPLDPSPWCAYGTPPTLGIAMDWPR